MKKNKKNKILIISFIVLGALLIVLGIILNSNNEKELTEEQGKNNVESEQTKYQEFNNYHNFKLKQTKVLDDYELTYEADIDNDSKIANVTIKKDEKVKYVYYDFTNSISYISDDNKTWYKTTFNSTKLPDYKEIIDKVIAINPFITENNMSISLTTSARLSGKLYNNVLTDVMFNKNGYIEKIKYDFSTVYNDSAKYTITYEISDVNNIEKIVIPNNIINSAKSGGMQVVVDF